MKRSDLIDHMSKRLDITKRETAGIIDELLDLVVQTLRRGDEVALGIGKFQLKQRAARTAVNPATGQKINVGPKVVPLFRPNKKFKSLVLE